MDWLEKVGLTQFGPSAVRGAILGIAGWLLTKNGMLSHWGIVSDAAAHTTTIYWNELSVAAIAGLPAVIAGVVKLLQYHGTNAINAVSQPQGEPPK
jgi:hypothetical protein